MKTESAIQPGESIKCENIFVPFLLPCLRDKKKTKFQMLTTNDHLDARRNQSGHSNIENTHHYPLD